MFFGWWVVGSAFLLAIWSSGFGLYSLSIYMVALQQQNGWSASTVSFAITTYYLTGALLMAWLGDAIHRLGRLPTVTTGIAAMALGVFALTGVTAVWQLHLAFILMALGWATTSSASINILLAPWFDRRRGLAVSLALSGAPLGGFIVAPALLTLIESMGFRLGVGITLLGVFALLLPAVVLTFGRTPGRFGLGPDGALAVSAHSDGLEDSGASMPDSPPARPSTSQGRSEALRTLRYWSISLAFAAALTAQIGTLAHLVAYLTPLRGADGAAIALRFVTMAALMGRLALGIFVDHLPLRILSCAVFLVQAAGFALLIFAATEAELYAGCVLFGFGVGNIITLPGLLVQREFRLEQFAGVVSLVAASNQIAFALGPSVLGVLRDATGSYTAALSFAGALDVLAAILILPGSHTREISQENAG